MSIPVSHRELLLLIYIIYYQTVIKNLSQANDMNPEDIQAKTATGLSLIMDRFPEERQALHRLFQESLSFQSLCNDYWECLAALQNWQQSTSEEALAWRDEYANLLLELEQEVRQYLENQAVFSTCPR
jgi:hypothetical protein